MMKKRQKSKQSYRKHSDSSSGEETELFTRKTTPKREIPTVDKVVEDSDTLQSLAIRYHCSIEDLKRLNNIHKENEIFAKRTIKVPYRPFSTALAGVHQSGRSSPEEEHTNTNDKIDCEMLKVKLNDNLEKSQNNVVNTIIFNSSIVPKDNVEQIEVIDGDFAEEILLLPQVEHKENIEPVLSRFHCSGVDGDISLKALILCIVIVIFAIPLIYVFYIAEHPETYNHHHNS